MIKFIKKFIQRKKLSNIVFFKSLGSRKYLSILKFVDGVIEIHPVGSQKFLFSVLEQLI